MAQHTLLGNTEEAAEMPNDDTFQFECVLDAPSLMAVLQHVQRNESMLKQWLRAKSLRVRVPQCVLGLLKDKRTEASQRTLVGLDRVTNHFENVKFEQSFESYPSSTAFLAAAKPPIHWHEFVESRAVANDEIAALSASLGNALQIDLSPNSLHKVDFAKTGNLADSAPMIEPKSAKLLAPIGTGRPGRTKATVTSSQTATRESSATHPIFLYMWNLMNKQHEDGIKRVWILASTDPILEKGAKDLGIPCMSQESLHKVLLAEFPEIGQKSSPNTSIASGTNAFAFPGIASSPLLFQPQLALNSNPLSPPNRRSPSMPHRDSFPAPVIAERRNSSLPRGSLGQLVPTEPRGMRHDDLGVTALQPKPAGVIMVDPNSFNRSPGTNVNNNLKRGGRADFKPGHRYRNSGQEVPANAPTGPRSMSGSSGNSKPNMNPISPTGSPKAQISQPVENVASILTLVNGARPSGAHLNRVPHADSTQDHRPVSRGANSPAIPSSPHLVNASPRAPPSINRGHRPPRHIPYVPPKAREQQVHQMNAAAATISNIDLSKPIDPESFGRGQLAAGTTKAQPVGNHSPHGQRRISSIRGGSMRGRSNRGSMRGRSIVNGGRKLFDPS